MLLHTSFLGDTGDDGAYAIEVDSAGDVYVTGYTTSTTYPTTEDAYDRTHNGDKDVFVSKLSANLKYLLASTLIGGADEDVGADLDFDSSGNVYVTGRSQSSGFPTTTGAFSEGHNDSGGAGGVEDVFVSKLDNQLETLAASTFVGGSGIDQAHAIVLDSSANVYIAGESGATNYPTTTGAYDIVHGGSSDAFISKVSSDLTSILKSTFIGGAGEDIAHDLILDSAGNVYITGETRSSGYPTTSGVYDESHNGNTDAFVSKFDGNLANLVTSTFIGGTDEDIGRSMSFSASGDVYITGQTRSADFPTTLGAFNTIHNRLGVAGEYHDAFVSKFSSDLNSLEASTFVGGEGTDGANDICHDAMNDVYITGGTSSFFFPTTEGVVNPNLNGAEDVFISKLDAELSGTGVCTLAISVSGKGQTDPPVGQYIRAEGEIVDITATPDDGWHFTNWTGDVDDPDSAETTVTMDLDKTVTANFAINTHTLTMSSVGDGSTSPVSGSHTYDYDTVVPITATPSDGWQFVRWKGDVDSPTSSSTTVTMDDDKTVTATFAQEVQMLTMSTNGSGTTTPESGSHSYAKDDIVDITADPADGWEFANWTGDVADPDSSSTTVAMDSDKTVTANFVLATYTLSISVNGDGTTDPQPGQYSHDANTEVVITATPDSGWKFTGWAGDVTDTSPEITVEMTSDMTVVANFAEKTFALTITINGEGFTTPMVGKSDHTQNSVVNLTAEPADGWQFVSWTGNVADTASPNTTIILSSDQAVVANFVQVTRTLSMAVNGNGTVTPDVGEHDYNDNEVVSISANPAEGWLFDGWTGDVADPNSSSTTITMDDSYAVIANFSQSIHTLTIVIDGRGITNPGAGEYTYAHKEGVELSANPIDGWRFKGWFGDIGQSESRTILVIMDSDKTITAEFVPPNSPPAAFNQTVTTLRESPVNITITGSDVDGDTLTFKIVNEPAHGKLEGTAPDLTYIPDLNYVGPDSFAYKVHDGTEYSNVATIGVTVETRSAAMEDGDDEDGEGMSLWILAVIAAAVLIVGVVVLLVARGSLRS
ncbi:MAG: SBBP repeat-containing protein [Chloroflexota bacterium]|nr:SBBP repeat-containing protein [Chloroflexota bacterium]